MYLHLRERVEKMLAVSLGEHTVVQHGDDATIVAGPDEAANALAATAAALRKQQLA